MKHAAFTLLLLLSTQALAEENFRIHINGKDVFLLNTVAGATQIFDRNKLAWQPLSGLPESDVPPTLIEESSANETLFTTYAVEFDKISDPIRRRIELRSRVINRSATKRRYNVAITLPPGSTFRSLHVLHQTIEGTMSGERLPAPESAFFKDTVYFDVVADALERLEISLTMANSEWYGVAQWRVRSDTGELITESTQIVLGETGDNADSATQDDT